MGGDRGRPLAASQTRAVWSSDIVTTRVESGAKRASLNEPGRRTDGAERRPPRTPHSSISPPRQVMARRRPSGLKRTERAGASVA